MQCLLFVGVFSEFVRHRKEICCTPAVDKFSIFYDIL